MDGGLLLLMKGFRLVTSLFLYIRERIREERQLRLQENRLIGISVTLLVSGIAQLFIGIHIVKQLILQSLAGSS